MMDIVHRLTDKPIRYLVNTTYHGDHTFGNYAFPEDVAVISSTKNKESMRTRVSLNVNINESLEVATVAASAA